MMMLEQPSSKELDRLLHAHDETIHNAGVRTLRQLQSAVGNYAVRAQQIIDDAIDDPEDEEAELRAIDMLDVGEQLREALLDAGFDDLADDFGDELKGMQDLGAEYFTTLQHLLKFTHIFSPLARSANTKQRKESRGAYTSAPLLLWRLTFYLGGFSIA